MIATIINSPWLMITVVGLLILLIFRARRRFLTFIFIPALTLTVLLGKIIKIATKIKRPFMVNPHVLGVSTYIPTDYAFPSLHTAIATLIGWTIAVIEPRFSYLGFIFIFLIAYSRVVLGLHTFFDIAGGFFMATIIFWSLYLFAQAKRIIAADRTANLQRKFVHFLYGSTLALLVKYQIANRPIFLLFTLFLTSIILLNHLKPLKYLNRSIVHFERKPYPKILGQGLLSFTWGSFLAVLLFPRIIATVSIFSLAVGDSINALVGYHLNHGQSNRGKRIAASLCAALSIIIVSLQYLPLRTILPAITITAIIEFNEPKIKGKTIDDNLFIPFLTGIIILLTQKLS